MGDRKILVKRIINKFRYILTFFINNSSKNAIKYVSHIENSYKKEIKVKFFDRIFSVPLSTSTLSAMIKLENKNENLEIYKCLNFPNVIYDVGSNIGYWIYPIYHVYKDYIDHVICIEPSKINYKFLQFNLDNINKISLYNYGLSDREETTRLGIPVWENRIHNTGLFSVLSTGSKEYEKIKLKTFDNIFTYNEKNDNYLLKIDVEGLEYKVLKGSKKFLNSKKNISIIIELNPNLEPYSKNNISKSIDILSKSGFKPYNLKNKRLTLIPMKDLLKLIENRIQINFVFKNF